MSALSDTERWGRLAEVRDSREREDWCFDELMSDQCERLIQSLSLASLSREDAADAAQEAFLQLYLHWDEVRNPIPWLYKVALNRCLDHRRRLLLGATLLRRSVGPSTGDWIAPDMAGTEFKDLLARLPLRQRTSATLYYLADLPISEIATVMNISEGSVNRHLHRAREALRSTLEAQ